MHLIAKFLSNMNTFTSIPIHIFRSKFKQYISYPQFHSHYSCKSYSWQSLIWFVQLAVYNVIIHLQSDSSKLRIPTSCFFRFRIYYISNLDILKITVKCGDTWFHKPHLGLEKNISLMCHQIHRPAIVWYSLKVIFSFINSLNFMTIM